jgi:phosphonopyruvate decarboxylase
MAKTGLPFAFVMKKDSVDSWPLKAKPSAREIFDAPPRAARFRPASATRMEMLESLRAAARPGDALLATTGFTGRELYALEDSENQLYMVGSMGCVSSLGLGMALAQPKRRIIAVDGDGALLMRLGALSTVGYERPPNLVHIVLDNGAYESTGGQTTLSGSVDLPAIAAACGYPRTREVTTPAELRAALDDHANDGLSFIHARILSGVPDGLPRPKTTPEEVARRLERFLSREDML